MGSGSDGANYLFRFGSGKNELHVLWRLFNNLQQCVRALGGDHVSFVQNKDLVAVSGWRVNGSLSKLSGIVNSIVRRSIDLNHIE